MEMGIALHMDSGNIVAAFDKDIAAAAGSITALRYCKNCFVSCSISIGKNLNSCSRFCLAFL